jgi:hypothetical protein
MNAYLSFTDNYNIGSHMFSTLRTRAQQSAFLAKLTGESTELAVFPDHNYANRRLIGIKDIQISQIVGTMNRDCDFDNKFRPLGEHLLDRWVNIFNFNSDSWPAIIVHKLGDEYYVEDGHHRVSVANSLGMLFIQAEVWEYPFEEEKAATGEKICCPDRSFSTSYATG